LVPKAPLAFRPISTKLPRRNAEVPIGAVSHTVASHARPGKRQVKPASMRHAELQPSPAAVLPSSHDSGGSTAPLPQVAQYGSLAHSGSAQSAAPSPSWSAPSRQLSSSAAGAVAMSGGASVAPQPTIRSSEAKTVKVRSTGPRSVKGRDPPPQHPPGRGRSRR
jgi:hypothetical protein